MNLYVWCHSNHQCRIFNWTNIPNSHLEKIANFPKISKKLYKRTRIWKAFVIPVLQTVLKLWNNQNNGTGSRMTKQINALWKETHVCRGNWFMIKAAFQRLENVALFAKCWDQLAYQGKTVYPTSYQTQKQIIDGLRFIEKENISTRKKY